MYGCYCGLYGIGVAMIPQASLPPTGTGREGLREHDRGMVTGSGGALVAYRALCGQGGPQGTSGRDLSARLLRASATVRWVVQWLEAHAEAAPGRACGPVGLAAYPCLRRRWMAERVYETGVLLRVELVRRGWTVSEEPLERLGTDVEREDRETVLRRAAMLARMARGVPLAGEDGRVSYAAR